MPLAAEHLEGAVWLHLTAFQGFFLASLGPGFLREFYQSFLADASALGFVALDCRGRILGAVVGTTEPSGHFRRLLHRRWWPLALAGMKACLRNPDASQRLLRGLAYRGGPPPGPSRALLSSIAVLPDCQGQGIGRQLLRAFLAAVRQHSNDGCYLTTDADHNDRVRAFYRRQGWRLESQYSTPEGRQIARYVIDSWPPEATIP